MRKCSILVKFDLTEDIEGEVHLLVSLRFLSGSKDVTVINVCIPTEWKLCTAANTIFTIDNLYFNGGSCASSPAMSNPPVI